MRAVTDITRGPGYLWRGFKLITEPGLRLFVALPVLINILVIAGLVWFFSDRLDAWLGYWLAGLPGWLAWLETLLWWLGLLLMLLLFCYAFTLLANLIASPFNGLLSARVEKLLTGREPQTELTLWGEMADGVKTELRKLIYYLSRLLLLCVISLVLLPIPVVDAAIPLLWFIFGAFMLSMEYLDHPMANRGMPFKAKLAQLQGRRGLGLGFGSAVTLMTALPVINLVVMPAAVAGATALWLEHMQEDMHV